jgi:fused signal recognition particle receptor
MMRFSIILRRFLFLRMWELKQLFELLSEFRNGFRTKSILNSSELNAILHDEIMSLLSENSFQNIAEPVQTESPYVIMVVGVNGVGKTTTIGKLAHMFKAGGKRVVLGAADTFRAAAVDQLTIWAERVGVPIVKQQMGADPAAVAFDTLSSAKIRVPMLL